MAPPAFNLPPLGPEERVYASLIRAAARSLVRPVGLSLAVLYGVFSTAHLVLWGGRAGTFMAIWALVSALVFLASVLIHEFRGPLKRPHLVLALFSFLALSNTLLHLALEENPVQTTNVVIIFLGVGALVFHASTLLGVLVVGWASWIGIGAYWGFNDPQWVHFGFAMISGSVVAGLIFRGRNHFIRRTAELESGGREREKRLRASRLRYKNLFAASPGMICIHDLRGNIIDANEAGVAAIGIPKDRLIGMNVGPFLLNNHREVPHRYLESLVRDGSYTGLMTVEGADGSMRRWKYRSTLQTDTEMGKYALVAALDVTESEEAIAALGRARKELRVTVAERTLALEEANRRLEADLEERKLMEEELRQKHKLEALGRLAGGIAHEFNNILTVLSGSVEFALDDAQAGEPSLENLKGIQWATARATTLVSQILAFSRMNLATHTRISLRPFLEETVTSLRDHLPEAVELALHMAGDLASARGSASQLRQVLENLVTNGVQALPEGGGTIRIQASVCHATQVQAFRMDVEEGTPCVRIQVSDSGRGILQDDQDRVFDPFFTTRGVGEGSGLGLSVAHGIIRSHGGDITLESEDGQGTTVTLLLPSVPSEEKPEEREIRVPPKPDTMILVVDDEQAITQLVSRNLARHGYQVRVSPGPREALAHVRENAGDLDLLLTDLSMPEMRGDELGMEVRRLRPGLPILFMTGYGGFLDLASSVKEGPTSILPKPFSGEALRQAVEGILRDAAREAGKARHPRT